MYAPGRCVFQGEQLVLTLDRKDGYDFGVGWAIDHPDGHDYLFFAGGREDQVLVQLDTGAQRRFLYEQRHERRPWYWYSVVIISPCKTMAATIGSRFGGYGGTRELNVFDISTPMSYDETPLLLFGGSGEDPSVESWREDGTLFFSCDEERTPLFGDKTMDDLTDEEWKKYSKARLVEGWTGPLEYERHVERQWHPDTGLAPSPS